MAPANRATAASTDVGSNTASVLRANGPNMAHAKTLILALMTLSNPMVVASMAAV